MKFTGNQINLSLNLQANIDRSFTAAFALNGDDSVQAAQQLALMLEQHAPGDSHQTIELSYRQVLNRRPTDAEHREAAEFLAAKGTTLADFCLALFNLNEFVYVD